MPRLHHASGGHDVTVTADRRGMLAAAAAAAKPWGIWSWQNTHENDPAAVLETDHLAHKLISGGDCRAHRLAAQRAQAAEVRDVCLVLGGSISAAATVQ